ncbi:MAG: lipid A deacylase LpxR family protein [Sphingobacteriaceae bacterium]|nr:MAG: lipid A deacylase LpxR family protein [Sphingobacteriaceae bacterium]
MRLKLIVLLLFISTTNVWAQTHSSEIGLQTDNDAYLTQGSDKYYTNGFFLHYRHALKTSDGSSLQNKVLGIELGQKIFNAQAGRIPEAKYVDRPIAGYLYAGANLNLLYKNESNLKLGAQVGIIGPGSLAKEAQTFIHDTFGLYSIDGWQFQIKNAAQVNLSAEYNRLLARATWIDMSLTSYANAGTGFTGAGAGPLIRIGNFNQLFNSFSTQSTAIANTVTPLHKQEFFFYYKPQFNLVVYDATIQGGMFNSRATYPEIVDKIKPAIFSQEFGVAYAGDRWILNFAMHTRSKESALMLAPHKWGSVTILYRFN